MLLHSRKLRRVQEWVLACESEPRPGICGFAQGVCGALE